MRQTVSQLLNLRLSLLQHATLVSKITRNHLHFSLEQLNVVFQYGVLPVQQQHLGILHFVGVSQFLYFGQQPLCFAVIELPAVVVCRPRSIVVAVTDVLLGFLVWEITMQHWCLTGPLKPCRKLMCV